MTRRLALLLMAAALTVAAVPGAAAAEDPPDGPIYLSLGTSLAAGVMADENGDSISESPWAYSDQLYRRLRDRIPGLEHVKLGCDNETTLTFNGGVNIEGNPSRCVDDYATGTQMGDALMWLQTGRVALVTIDLGANDANQWAAFCQFDPSCLLPELENVVATVGTIVGTLRVGGAYGGPIIGMTYYNPNVAAAIGYFSGIPGRHAPDPGFAALSDALATGLNAGLTHVYRLTGAAVADVYTAFNSGDFGDDKPSNDTPDNVDRVCRLTYMCPDEPDVKANIHPNKHGYRVMAKTFFRVYKAL
jgi:lysophospholipase L1-like esterase